MEHWIRQKKQEFVVPPSGGLPRRRDFCHDRQDAARGRPDAEQVSAPA